MSAAFKYTLGRVGIFVACAVPVLLLVPSSVDFLLKLIVAFLVSSAVSYFALRRWKDELADTWAVRAQQRASQRESLRSALAGDGAADIVDQGENVAESR